jgi:hypothetical protein
MSEKQEPTESAIGRRRLLRRAGGVAAGVVGGTVVAGIAAPTAASAAAGGNLILGQGNDSGTATTGLNVANPTSGTLGLSNSAAPVTVPVNNVNVDQFGPQLRLVPPAPGPSQYYDMADGEVGSLGVMPDGTLWTVADQGFSDQVYTSFLANLMVAITPTRVLDTRTAAGRANIIDAGGNLDSQGRLMGGHAININLSPWPNIPGSGYVYAGTAVHANMTVVNPLGEGFASLLPGGLVINGYPTTSNINYSTNETIPNFALCVIGAALGFTDVVKVFSSNSAHVILDVFAFTVNFAGQVNPTYLPGASGATAKAQQFAQSRAQLARSGRPTWAKQ